MNRKVVIFALAFWCTFVAHVFAQTADSLYHEQFRPQIHFSPKAHWMNDPNGMVYFNHTYHLFFQYYPNATVWGPMHWGHAVSKDLVHWMELPIALYPDSLGYIFSGSAVVDSNNTSGFGRKGKIPLVAIFTHHHPGDNKQSESLAYSLDGGYHWTKYAGNPVIPNPGVPDFRDPKVSWNRQVKKWIMTLAVGNHVEFYSSPNLKSWTKESEFGKMQGAHGGVWECPDLFPLKLKGKTYWTLVVNINPGGPNKGSATQYFVGQFNGHRFTPADTLTRWLDYGPDEYAGVTWSNTPGRHIFLGWMSNWSYATVVPTGRWRSACTVPRELGLFEYGGHIYIRSTPVRGFDGDEKTISAAYDNRIDDLDTRLGQQYVLKMSFMPVKNFEMRLENKLGDKLVIGYKKDDGKYYIDRTDAGTHDFNKDFASVEKAPRLSNEKSIKLTLVVDRASLELFADDGKTVMTCIFFPKAPLEWLKMDKIDRANAFNISSATLKSIW